MKKSLFLISFLIIAAAEIIALIIFAVQTPYASLDTVAVNEVTKSVTQDFDNLDSHKNNTGLNYVVLDNGGNVIYRTEEGLSESINIAVKNRDTILDVTADGEVLGKIIIHNDGQKLLKEQKQTAVIILSCAIALNCAICLGYAVYLKQSVIKPFGKLKGFAERVAGGNLDIPLEMDRQNLFGAFTESFDIMRSELKKARIAEAQANKSKKELVAKLSHDIKTPVASIKAVSEVGLAVTSNDKDKANYKQIIKKADQINTLITNLFTATLEELRELTVQPVNTESTIVEELIENADYLKKAEAVKIPRCLIYADKLRLQQVLDNIFANSYKYAGTDIKVKAEILGGFLSVSVEDCGGGVEEEEVSLLKEKYKRGKNSANIEGAGLGLYISDYFMREMKGELKIENGERGLKVTVSLSLSGKT